MPDYTKSVTGIQLVHSKLVAKLQERGLNPKVLFGHPKQCLVSADATQGRLTYIVTTYDKHGQIASYMYDDIETAVYYIQPEDYKGTGMGWLRYTKEEL